MGDKKIGLREIRSLQPGETIWDATIPGFGARRQRSPAVSYVLIYRTGNGRQRWHTIGRHGAPWTPDMAREEARRLLGEVVTGADPAADKISKRKAATVAELCDLYLADAEAGRLLTRQRQSKKPSTLATDRGRIERHIKPLLGRLSVLAVTRNDIDGFMHAVAEGKTAGKIKTKPRGLAHVRGGKGTASRTVGLVGAIFSYAIKHRMRADNPARGVVRFADGKRERRLSDEEYRLLGDTLRNALAEKAAWPPAVALVRFLALTGWRLGEALGLRWSEIDLPRRTARLPDTKTGFSLRPLSIAACDVLKGMNYAGDLVFPATKGDGVMAGFKKMFARMSRDGGLPVGITAHVLRHSFASLAGDLGYSEPTIAVLVGHKGRSITSRYVHSADAVLLAAADAVANRTVVLMGDQKTGAVVVELRPAVR
jgi:integrase